MKLRRNFRKIVAMFITAISATLFGSSQSQALSLKTQELEQLNLENRLQRVREELKIKNQSSSSADNSPENLSQESKQNLLAWGDWYNGWRNWGNYY